MKIRQGRIALFYTDDRQFINAQNENTEVRSKEPEAGIFHFTEGSFLWDIGKLSARRII